MAVHNGCNGSGRQVIEVTLGADRAWWSDWSSKPAGVLLDLGRFDSYTLPPHPARFVSHPGDRRRRTGLSKTRAASTSVSSGPWHQPRNTSRRGRRVGDMPPPSL